MHVGADAFVRPAKRSELGWNQRRGNHRGREALQGRVSREKTVGLQPLWLCSGPTPSTTISSPKPPAQPSKSSKPPDTASSSPKPISAADARYDFGMLDRAQSLLLEILDQLEPEIEAGIPIVGLEPSCVAVFRDELVNLFT